MAGFDKRLTLALAIACVMAACARPDEAPAAPVEPSTAAPVAPVANAALAACAPATGDGFCGVSFGVSPQAAKTAFPVPLVRYSGDANALHDPDACFEMFGEAPAEGVSFLVEGDKVGRVDVIAPGPVTSDGFGVGSKADDIRTKYGATLQEGPNKYEPEIVELSVSQGAGKVVFEIQDGVVRAWRAGVPPLIDYVERCG